MTIKSAEWNSIHMLSVTKEGTNYIFGLETTVLLNIDFKANANMMSINSEFKKKTGMKIGEAGANNSYFVGNIGKMIEELECNIRNEIESLHLIKIQTVNK